MAAPERTATRFFWTVLLCATAVSIGGNAIHATLNTTSVPAPLAAAVATVPPLVLLASTEGVSMLMRARRNTSVAYWCALAMTALLAVCAFAMSFDALRDLASRAGIRAELAWLWPIAVDASIAQCTVALLSLSRNRVDEVSAADAEELFVTATAHEHPSVSLAEVTPGAAALVEEGVTKQSPETVAEVLKRARKGEKPGAIATKMGLHHTTVTRLLNADHRRTRPAAMNLQSHPIANNSTAGR